jgi:hypothetical protein
MYIKEIINYILMNNIVIADIYDIYPTQEFIEKRINNNELNIDFIINDKLLHKNIVYVSIFNHIYKTYPTKKDFIDTQLFNKNFEFTEEYITYISSLFFFKTDFKSIFYKLENLLKNKDFVIKTIIDKIKYRYNVNYSNNNLYRSILKIYELYKPLENIEYGDDFNVFSNNKFSKSMFNEDDLNYLCEYEIIQYCLYKDFCFIKYLSENSTILIDMSTKIDNLWIKRSSDRTNKYGLKLFSNNNYKKIIKTFCFSTKTNYFILNDFINVLHLIPSIAKYHLTISDYIYPNYSPKSNNSYYLIVDNNIKNVNNNIEYSIILSTPISYIKNSYLFPHYENIDKNNMIDYWKGYTSGNNKLILFYDYVLRYIDNTILDNTNHNYKNDNENVVFLIDNRENYLSIVSFMITLKNLDETWTGILYTNEKSYDFYNKYLGNIINIKCLEKLNKKFNIENYNSILLDINFWKNLETYNRCLIIQDDGMLIKKGIKDYLKYDYIGAPWADADENIELKQYNKNLIGNGGFSLRNPKIMIKILETFTKEKDEIFFYNLIKIPEDVYFCKYIQQINNIVLPTRDIASNFSSEQILNYNSIGFHKIWHYHGYSELKRFFK